jgi:hypothetical protein
VTKERRTAIVLIACVVLRRSPKQKSSEQPGTPGFVLITNPMETLA